jgi:hypothetical protein
MDELQSLVLTCSVERLRETDPALSKLLALVVEQLTPKSVPDSQSAQLTYLEHIAGQARPARIGPYAAVSPVSGEFEQQPWSPTPKLIELGATPVVTQPVEVSPPPSARNTVPRDKRGAAERALELIMGGSSLKGACEQVGIAPGTFYHYIDRSRIPKGLAARGLAQYHASKPASPPKAPKPPYPGIPSSTAARIDQTKQRCEDALDRIRQGASIDSAVSAVGMSPATFYKHVPATERQEAIAIRRAAKRLFPRLAKLPKEPRPTPAQNTYSTGIFKTIAGAVGKEIAQRGFPPERHSPIFAVCKTVAASLSLKPGEDECEFRDRMVASLLAYLDNAHDPRDPSWAESLVVSDTNA